MVGLSLRALAFDQRPARLDIGLQHQDTRITPLAPAERAFVHFRNADRRSDRNSNGNGVSPNFEDSHRWVIQPKGTVDEVRCCLQAARRRHEAPRRRSPPPLVPLRMSGGRT